MNPLQYFYPNWHKMYGIGVVLERVRRGGVHLASKTVGGAVSGYRYTLCGLRLDPRTPGVSEESNAPLCNHCGRVFTKQMKRGTWRLRNGTATGVFGMNFGPPIV